MYEGYNGGPLINPLARVQAEEHDYCTCDIRHPSERRVCAVCGKAIYWMEPTMILHVISCSDCDGSGSCAFCEGSGMVVGVIGDQERSYVCGECDGNGYCSVCSGSGEIEVKD